MRSLLEQRQEKQRILMEQKLQRAEEKRKKQLELIVKKAHDEEEKVCEIVYVLICIECVCIDCFLYFN